MKKFREYLTEGDAFIKAYESKVPKKILSTFKSGFNSFKRSYHTLGIKSKSIVWYGETMSKSGRPAIKVSFGSFGDEAKLKKWLASNISGYEEIIAGNRSYGNNLYVVFPK